MDRRIPVIMLILAAIVPFLVMSVWSRYISSSSVKQIQVPKPRLDALNQLWAQAPALSAQADQEQKDFLKSLSPEARKAVEEFQNLQTRRASLLSGLQFQLNDITKDLKLEFTKSGRIPAAELQKYQLYRTEAGNWVLADAEPPSDKPDSDKPGKK